MSELPYELVDVPMLQPSDGGCIPLLHRDRDELFAFETFAHIRQMFFGMGAIQDAPKRTGAEGVLHSRAEVVGTISDASYLRVFAPSLQAGDRE